MFKKLVEDNRLRKTLLIIGGSAIGLLLVDAFIAIKSEELVEAAE